MSHDQSGQREREASGELNDAASEIAQAAVAVITSESILERIPIAKTGLAVWKMVNSIRDQLLMRKLEIFWRNLASVASEERRAMAEPSPISFGTICTLFSISDWDAVYL